MYCAVCGSTLPIEALFCPRCGKRSILDEVTPDTALPETPTNTGIDAKGNGEVLEPALSPQSEANPATPASETNTTTNAVALAFALSPPNKTRQSPINSSMQARLLWLLSH